MATYNLVQSIIQIQSHYVSFYFRSGQKLLQQRELERKMREYNDYFAIEQCKKMMASSSSSDISNATTNSVQNNITPNCSPTAITGTTKTKHNNNQRNSIGSGGGGGSRLELTSREVIEYAVKKNSSRLLS